MTGDDRPVTARGGLDPAAPTAARHRAYRVLGHWRDETIGAAFLAAARRFGPRVALVDGDTRMTYRELAVRSAALAANLRALGFRRGESLLIALPNRWEYVVLLLACLRAGIVPVLMLPVHREHELTRIADHVRAVGIAVAGDTPDGAQPRARRVSELCASVDHVLVAGGTAEPGTLDLRTLAHPTAAAPLRSRRPSAGRLPVADADALHLLSGGTTGLPKVIARTHNDYLYVLRHSARLSEIGASDVYLVALPAAHTFPLGCPGLLGTLLHGGRVVLAASPRPDAVFAAIAREGVTVTAAVPSVVQRWLQEYDPGRWDLSSLRLLQVGGARLSRVQAARVGPTFGCALQQVYGMSEGLLNSTRLDDAAETVLGTQGRPVGPGDEIRVVDESGRDVADGGRGELLTRGPGITPGYHLAPRHDAEAFTAQGWFRTGDLVRRRPDGNLVVEGRVKDVINRGGEKICADEIEDLLHELPQVDRAAVLATPDPDLGERVCACLVLRPGRSLALAEIRTLLAARGVATYKLPERVEVLQRLPLTAVGKINKAELRETIGRDRAPHPTHR